MGGPINAQRLEQIKLTGARGGELLRRRMDATGDGTGTKDMSTTADDYYILAQNDETYVIDNLRIVLEDTGDMPWEEFAAEGATLATGIGLDIVAQSGATFHQVQDLLDSKLIQQNSHFLHLGNCSLSLNPAGLSILVVEIDFKVLLGYPLRFTGKTGFLQGLRIRIQDDLSGLDSLEVWANGISKTPQPNL